MSLLIFTPYGSYSPETGLLFALARYLHSRGYGLINMRCNGALLSCGRDGNSANRRSVLTCIQCMNDSEALTRWAEIPSLDLSPYIKHSDIEEYEEELVNAFYGSSQQMLVDGIELRSLIAPSEAYPAAGQAPELGSPKCTRRDLIQKIRLIRAFGRVFQQHQVDAVLSLGQRDFVIDGLHKVAAMHKVQQYQFTWLPEKMVMTIASSVNAREYRSELMLDGVISMRGDVESWPEPIQQEFLAIEQYMEISQQQLSLPMI